MPGHKLGRGVPGKFRDSLFTLDLTEIPGTDNLHYPDGPIKDAQELAAEAFGADETFFLVNGSTCGIQAVIAAACKPGDKLIIGRDCHKSVISGMMLAGVRPLYIKPEYDSSFGIPTVLRPSDIEEAIVRNPDASAVMITRPNYYGVCSDIEQIAGIVHSFGKMLVVDEAHGAHLAFNSGLPVCAMKAGADICVQSAHKTLPAVTQGSYLHVKYGRVDMEKLKFCLRIFQTTSPSYIIMSMLDIAREILVKSGERRLNMLLRHIEYFRKAVEGCDKLALLKGDNIGSGELDRTRVTVNVRKLGITGFEAEKMLRREYNIQVEMSDLFNIVCITTIADRRKNFERLASALEQLAGRFNDSARFADIYFKEPGIPEQKLGLRDVMQLKSSRVRLESAVGRICRDIITPYPPGTPVICPGEIIEKDAVEYIYNVLESGGTVGGIRDDFEVSVIE